MGRISWLSFVLLGLVAVGATCSPVIGVDNATYTATVQSGSSVAHVFKLTNTGDAALSITGVQASCGCTTTTLAKSQLMPGESVDLEARVNTTGFSGTVQKLVTVKSDDPVTPSLVLHLVLTIVDNPPPTPVSAATSTQQTATAARPPHSRTSCPWWPIVAAGAGGAALMGLSVLGAQRARRTGKRT